MFRKVCQGGDIEVRIQPDFAAYAYRTHTGAAGGFYAGRGVFYYDRAVRLNAQALCRYQEDFGIWLAVADIFGGGECFYGAV